ncbi:MAG: hypothetical protein GWN13_03775 [Phycisphaerae bacterium]|nr:hypothetical protein [Phycisphaerae bacterium]
MVDKLGISVWTLGGNRVVTFTEYDADHKALYRITYPIDYSEGSDLSSWASRRIKDQGCDFHLSSDGWDIYVPIESVISDSVHWHPIHTNSRTNPKMTFVYEKLVEGYHKITYNPSD